MEIWMGIYFAVGFICGMNVISKVKPTDDASMACIYTVIVMLCWPIYLSCKLYEKYKK